MLQPSFVPPWKHVFRSLLREAAYLPDPIARRYMRSYILESYHFHWPHIVPRSSSTPHGQTLLERRARQLLSVLRRANEGYIKPLERVLLLSYARIGRRRYELLEPYFGIIQSTRPKYRRDPGPMKEMPPRWSPTESLRMLVESQSMNSYVKESKVVPVIRMPYPPKDVYTKSGKQIPRQKVMQKWYDSLIERVLPPLPAEEWHTLHGLLVGTEPWALPERRKPAWEGPSVRNSPKSSQQQNTFDPSDSEIHQLDEDWELTPDLKTLTPEFLVFGPKKGQTFRPYVRGRPHTITRRFMTTLWQDILQLTPRFEFANDTTHTTTSSPHDPLPEPTQGHSQQVAKPKEASDALEETEEKRTKPRPSTVNTNRYVVFWGKPEMPAPIFYTVGPTLTDLVFGGVDRDGRVIRKKSRKPVQKRGALSDLDQKSSNVMYYPVV
ncbi:hypothetical protein KEM56_006202 [Ascosphaera pollenicola]|nr:hypothetical protein KEM56_006202 [Ascosphaera pollenicola]